MALIESQKLTKEINRANHLNQNLHRNIVDKDLEHCPELLKNYLKFVGVSKKAYVNKATIFRRGKAKKLTRFNCRNINLKIAIF